MPLSEAQMRQKMAKSVTQKGGSLVPPGIANKSEPAPLEPEPESKYIPVEELIQDKEVVTTLNNLAKLYKEQSGVESKAKKLKEGAGSRIKECFKSYGIGAAKCNHYTIGVTASSRKTVNPMKLLALGVSQEVIDAATDVTETQTIRVNEVK